MKTNVRTKKEFDAVDMMRSIRERISKEIQGMSFEQEKGYLRRRLTNLRRGTTAKRPQ